MKNIIVIIKTHEYQCQKHKMMMFFDDGNNSSNRTRRPAVYVLVLLYFCVHHVVHKCLAMNIFVVLFYTCLCVCVCISLVYTRKCFSIAYKCTSMGVCSIYIGAKSMHTQHTYVLHIAYIMVDFPKEQSYIKPIWLPFSLQYYARFSSIFITYSLGKSVKIHVN